MEELQVSLGQVPAAFVKDTVRLQRLARCHGLPRRAGQSRPAPRTRMGGMTRPTKASLGRSLPLRPSTGRLRPAPGRALRCGRDTRPTPCWGICEQTIFSDNVSLWCFVRRPSCPQHRPGAGRCLYRKSAPAFGRYPLPIGLRSNRPRGTGLVMRAGLYLALRPAPLSRTGSTTFPRRWLVKRPTVECAPVVAVCLTDPSLIGLTR